SSDGFLADSIPQWQEGDWAYEWQGNGMLRSVKRPDGKRWEYLSMLLGIGSQGINMLTRFTSFEMCLCLEIYLSSPS
uniref:hypothetical protein n=1 Tax=Prevotella heparinolytica TaxID=28113 RepID=UPI0035A1CCC4